MAAVHTALRRHALDGWLFAGGRTPDPALGAVFRVAPPAHVTRPWMYFVPADLAPIRVVHALEPAALDGLPGQSWVYHSREQWQKAVAALVEGHENIAVQWSPRGAIPAADILPAGWMELLRDAGAVPSPSAPLLGELAALSPVELAGHERAADILTRAVRETLEWLGRRAAGGHRITERAVQAALMERAVAAGLALPDPPIVAFGEHTADPHYAIGSAGDTDLAPGDLVLVDAWGREAAAGSIYADLTWMAIAAEEPSHEAGQLFAILCAARDQAVAVINSSAQAGKVLTGADVDRLVRGLLEPTDHHQYFPHRTGHSLGTEVHGIGVNLDSLESDDDRALVPGTVFTIEPGIYLPGRMGLRTEINVALAADGRSARVTTAPWQDRLACLLA